MEIQKDGSTTYDVQIVGLEAKLKPGDSIHVDCRQVVGGVTVFSVQDDLTIEEVGWAIDDAGIRTESLRLREGYWTPTSDAELLALLYQRQTILAETPQPIVGAYIV